jgi:hypothetical protein
MDDDTDWAPELFDADESDPTAGGIVRCLHMLAEEAATLRLARTLAALRTAIDVCAAESDGGGTNAILPPGTRLH